MPQPDYAATEWAKALRRFSRQAVEEEISRYYLENSTKYQPDLAVLVDSLLRRSQPGPPPESARFYELDRLDQIWWQARHEAEAAMRAETEPERWRHRAALRILARQIVRMARVWHEDCRRLASDPDPWPPGDPEAQQRIRRHAERMAERTALLAERLLPMAGMSPHVLSEVLHAEPNTRAASCPPHARHTNVLSNVVCQALPTCALTGRRGRG